ncbi:hypothetical protein [Micromonospora echinofusca]|uniref:WD40-like Beta Propeller Repeat n=1 Tax=Micromonospora echinofusca TaxID=47858 RepID=A0ABS3VYU1_MICEH|nr:hypothetical protein [Micromonospora echinofusca]MBO4209710.1 hypothetical protein [Micromonospora echinofusca]
MTTTSTRTSPGRRRYRPGALVGLVAALAAGAALLASSPGPAPRPAGPRPPGTVAEVWPQARRFDLPANVADGPAYVPGYVLDGGASVGTAASPDGSWLRLLFRAADGGLRELRRLPVGGSPQYGGFARAGDDLAWAESTGDEQGRGRTELWTVDLAGGGPPRRLTADTGDLVLFNSQYDLVWNGGRLYWLAVAPDPVPGSARGGIPATPVAPATEVRSVPLTGGPVSVRTEPGAWALSAWPWLVSAGSGEYGPVRLHNLETRTVTGVPADGNELVTCGPVWCRVLVLAGTGPGRLELVRTDGSDRHRVAGGEATAAVIDVALRDRFEVLVLADAQRTATGTQQLRLYDLARRRTVTVADGVGMVASRDGLLWWSTGTDADAAWHVLDLRSLD